MKLLRSLLKFAAEFAESAQELYAFALVPTLCHIYVRNDAHGARIAQTSMKTARGMESLD